MRRALMGIVCLAMACGDDAAPADGGTDAGRDSTVGDSAMPDSTIPDAMSDSTIPDAMPDAMPDASDAATCPDGQTECGGSCVDTTSDDAHCGACDAACPSGELCVDSVCACAAGTTRCGDACVDITSDVAHCGACDAACNALEVCTDSTCECAPDTVVCGEACTDTMRDPMNCGACGNVCATGACGSGLCSDITGCADGEREGFTDVDAHPSIAGCSGAWDFEGIQAVTEMCELQAGDDVPAMAGCSAADLCAPGWALCGSAAEVANRSNTGCMGATLAGDPSLFFASEQSGPGSRQCDATGTDDVFGCGNITIETPLTSCDPLDAMLTSSAITPGWSFGGDPGEEAATVTKPTSETGGVLCCRQSNDIGCADASREGFVNTNTHPDIAGCSGGWDQPGVLFATPQCSRSAGNDTLNPDGVGCGVADLCAAGWHVCQDALEVNMRSTTGCGGSVPGGTSALFVTSQSGEGFGRCEPSGANDVFGCGNVGNVVLEASCSPLNRRVPSAPAPWDWGSDGGNEANNLIKPGPELGGVLCCRD